VRRVTRRTWVAAAVTALAIAAPCLAWYVAGSRSAEQEATRLEQAPIQAARQEAQLLAHQLELRLESMRLSESRRSHLDYLNQTDWLDTACAQTLLVDSPLAQGPADPLIWTHFQLDPVGQLSLPTLAGHEAPDAADSGRAIELAILDELECTDSQELAALRLPVPEREREVRSLDGTTTVTPFSWHSVSVKGQPALVALRKVATPGAVLTQGFVVLAEDINNLLSDSPDRIRILPGEPSAANQAPVPLGAHGWVIEVDPSGADAERRAAAVRRRFRWTFAGGSSAAMLAGVFLVSLVWQADRLARRRARFAASAAHELRTPLAGLRMYGEMLAEGLGDPERRQQYARHVAEEADRLGRVVTNVLSYSRLERGGLRVQASRGDLAAAVRDSVERLTPTLEARGATLALSIDAAVSTAWFDRDAVHQILENLVDNAEKYSRAASDRAIRIVLTPAEAGPVLAVIDRGDGVAPALRRRLFEPFVRHSDTAEPGGLGIGLAMVRALAREQQADVSHADEPGGGSRFTVQFRRSVVREASDRASNPP